MYFAFEDYNTAVLSVMYDELISRVQPDIVAITGVLSHQIGPPSNRPRPTGKFIEKLKKGVVGDGVEIVLADDEAAQSLLDYFKIRPESIKICVFGCWHGVTAECEFRCWAVKRLP